MSIHQPADVNKDMNGEQKTCQNCGQQFIIEPDDFSFYEKMKVPAPMWCPECRLQRRLAWRNERTLFKRTCDLCKKSIISNLSQEKPFMVYCEICWPSDQWEATTYGRVYDFSTPFFVQWMQLCLRVPLPNLMSLNNINCAYVNLGRDNKNCYLSVSVIECEDCSYVYRVDRSRSCLDCSFAADCELCYEVIDSNACNRVAFARYAENCLDSFFLFNCRNVSNCLGCVNLSNVSHCILNKQYTSEEYRKRLGEITDSASSLAQFRDDFLKLCRLFPRRYANLRNTVNVQGDNLSNFRNCIQCFDGTKTTTGENCKFILGSIGESMSSYDVSYPIKPLFTYEVQSGEVSYSAFSNRSNACHHVQYTHECYSSSNLFGCTGLRSKEYCILNKQYTKEEYEVLVPKIIEHMNKTPYVDKQGREYRYGEFFPYDLSPFAYNETVAQEYFPLTKELALQQGFRWKNPEVKGYTITKYPQELPNSIQDVDNSVLGEVIGCAHRGACLHWCSTAFKIISEELAFYRKIGLPLPKLCPNCRHHERLAQRNPLKLWHRRCMCAGIKSDPSTDSGQETVYMNTGKHTHGEAKCPNEFETSYAPERPEIVYCENCYQVEVV